MGKKKYNPKYLIRNVFRLLIVSMLIGIVYANLSSLNGIKIIFVKLGSVLLLVGAYFFGKYLFKLYKNVKYLIKIQHKYTKLVLGILLLLLVIHAFNQREGLFDPVSDFYHANKDKLYPFSFGDDTSEIIDYSNNDNSKNIFEKVKDKEKPKISITKLERRIHDLMNIERRNNNLKEFEWNDKIAKASRLHSEDMASRNFYSHDSPEGKGFVWRYNQVGFDCAIPIGDMIYGGAENIHQNWLANSFYAGNIPAGYNSMEDLAQQAVQGWMDSRGHRENILTPFFSREGIGVAVSEEDGKVYFTQNFC